MPLNPLYRNPPPAANDPKAYDDPVTVPAGDIAENPYWKRDVRRGYPQLSVVNQGDIVGLLTVGSKAAPREDVLQIGDAGQKQLVAVQEEGQKTGLPTFFKKEKGNMTAVLGADGLPPLPSKLGQNMTGKRYQLTELPYGDRYMRFALCFNLSLPLQLPLSIICIKLNLLRKYSKNIVPCATLSLTNLCI